MPKSKIRKRLIEPKVRLLLWIHLKGIKDKENWRSKLSKVLDYSKGSADSELTSLIYEELIESLNPDSTSPPYRLTEKGNSFLQPILFTQKIGIFAAIWALIYTIILYALLYNQPVLMASFWIPLLIISFITLVVILIFYPYLLVYGGRRAYPSKS